MMSRKKYVVELSSEEREHLETLISKPCVDQQDFYCLQLQERPIVIILLRPFALIERHALDLTSAQRSQIHS